MTRIGDATTAGTRQWSRPAADDWIHLSRPRATTRSQGTGTFGWPQKMSASGSSSATCSWPASTISAAGATDRIRATWAGSTG